MLHLSNFFFSFFSFFSCCSVTAQSAAPSGQKRGAGGAGSVKGGAGAGAGAGRRGRGAGAGGGGGGHMAFNYWFHPPDVCEKGKHLQPYSSAFWERTLFSVFFLFLISSHLSSSL